MGTQVVCEGCSKAPAQLIVTLKCGRIVKICATSTCLDALTEALKGEHVASYTTINGPARSSPLSRPDDSAAPKRVYPVKIEGKANRRDRPERLVPNVQPRLRVPAGTRERAQAPMPDTSSWREVN